MITNLLTGMMIGFVIAAPIGPIDMICIQRTLAGGMRAGFITGMGAAFADAIYGALASFGLLSVTSMMMGYDFLFQLGGGVFLCGLGVKTLLSAQGNASQVETKGSLSRGFMSTFFLVMMSPMTILSFVGAYAVLGNESETSVGGAVFFTVGVFSGSAIWWFILSGAVALYCHRLNTATLCWINRISGALLISFGIAALVFSTIK